MNDVIQELNTKTSEFAENEAMTTKSTQNVKLKMDLEEVYN